MDGEYVYPDSMRLLFKVQTIVFVYYISSAVNCLLLRTNQSVKDENEPGTLTEDDWKRLNDIIGYKEGDDERSLFSGKGDLQLIDLDLHMRHNASKLIDGQECLADLSCDNLDCHVKLFSESKVFEIKLGSYRLVSPNGLLAEVCILCPSPFSIFLMFQSFRFCKYMTLLVWPLSIFICRVKVLLIR